MEYKSETTQLVVIQQCNCIVRKRGKPARMNTFEPYIYYCTREFVALNHIK